jgi:hypothetical protein
MVQVSRTSTRASRPRIQGRRPRNLHQSQLSRSGSGRVPDVRAADRRGRSRNRPHFPAHDRSTIPGARVRPGGPGEPTCRFQERSEHRDDPGLLRARQRAGAATLLESRFPGCRSRRRRRGHRRNAGVLLGADPCGSRGGRRSLTCRRAQPRRSPVARSLPPRRP